MINRMAGARGLHLRGIGDEVCPVMVIEIALQKRHGYSLLTEGGIFW
jgi:hypothetical protein